MPTPERTHRAPSQTLPARAADYLDVLIEAVPDATTRRAILADNPQRLYGFDYDEAATKAGRK